MDLNINIKRLPNSMCPKCRILDTASINCPQCKGTGYDIPLPRYQTFGSAGMDLRAAIYRPLKIKTGQTTIIGTGIAIELPEGYEAQIRNRSGLSSLGIVIDNSPATIDSDYRGEISVMLRLIEDGVAYQTRKNLIYRGNRIAQIVIVPIVRANWKTVENLSCTPRGERGFGHTGI